MSHHYPIALRLQGKRCLVVGGGMVAYRKVLSLLECGAEICVVSPELGEELESLLAEGRIMYHAKEVEEADLAGVFLVIGATNDRLVNAEIGRWADKRNLLVNIVDQPLDCNFIVPAVHRVGALTMTVTTDGKSPALAAKIKGELVKQYSESYGVALAWLGEIRSFLLAEMADAQARRALLLHLVDGEWLSTLHCGDGDTALQQLAAELGEMDGHERVLLRLHKIWEEMRDCIEGHSNG